MFSYYFNIIRLKKILNPDISKQKSLEKKKQPWNQDVELRSSAAKGPISTVSLSLSPSIFWAWISECFNLPPLKIPVSLSISCTHWHVGGE